MSSQYRKIKYESEGPYGSTEEKWLYVWSHDTVDITHVFGDDGEEIAIGEGENAVEQLLSTLEKSYEKIKQKL